MAPLRNPVPRELREELSEKMYDDDSGLELSYDGSLVWLGIDLDEDYGISFCHTSDFTLDELIFAAADYNLIVLSEQARSFSCLWYNGADSNMSTMTVEEFLQKTRQSNK
jgi:hypothetical protein